MIHNDAMTPQSAHVEAMAVHLVQTYPNLVATAPGTTHNHFRTQLARITLGDWARVSDRDAKRTQLVLGVYEGQIVSAYVVDGYTRDPADRRIRWSGVPADDFAGLIGTSLPGGGWVRGQARPIRKVQVPHSPGDALAAMAELALAMSRYNLEPQQSQLSAALESKIQVRVHDPRTVVLKVPSGVNVHILTDGNHLVPPEWVKEP